MPTPASFNKLDSFLAIPRLRYHIDTVEKNLELLIQNTAEPIRQPALRMLQGGGKRLRPTLVIAAGLCQGAELDNNLLTAAGAIELLHFGSLVHDDLLDHATSRWNQPTIFGKEGQSAAILVGDYFLAHAVAEGAKVSAPVAAIIAQTIGTMCEGQSLESANLYNLNRTLDNYYEATRQKTAVVLAAACQIGGIYNNSPTTQLKALTSYGEAFGMAFQLTDDLLDLLAESSQLGKPTGNDVKEGNYTLPIVEALQGPLSSKLRRLIQSSPNRKKDIICILSESGSLKATVERIKAYNQQAKSALRELKPSKAVEGLAELPTHYWRWAQQHTVLPLR